MRERLQRWLDGLSFRQRVLALFAAVMVVPLAVMVWQATAASASQRSYEAVAADHLQLRQALRHLQRYYGTSMGVVWTQHVALGRLTPQDAVAELRAQRLQAAAHWARVAALAATLGSDSEELVRLGSLRGPADAAVEQLERILDTGDQSALMSFFALDVDPATAPVLAWIDEAGNRLGARESLVLARGQAELRRHQFTSYAVVLGACTLMLLLLPVGLRDLTRGIDRLTAVARRLTARDFSARPDHVPGGELGELAQAFVTMQEALAHYEHELHERELEARAASQAKSMFLAAMSHEIRTPLIGVLGMLEVLGRSALDTEQRRQFTIVHQSAHSLLGIIGDILDYSKIEAGKVDLAPEPCALRDIVSRVVSTFSATAESKGLQLVQLVDSQVAQAHVVDEVRLMQILRNFISNGIKFTERGSVTVAVQVLGGDAERQQLRFSVADTGIGMTPDQLARLFQAFTQADAGTTRRFGGTGLGLVICRRLAELMGGTVQASSEPGRGTVMTLELQLPVGEARATARAAATEHAPVVTRARPTREQAQREGSLLLLAEDHPVNREVLTSQLNLAGFCVDTAEDGMRAFETFAAGHYALVLTDLHMPGLDGFQLTAAIREWERSNGRPRTPILALTADVLREHVQRCLTSGMDDYVSKPVTIRRLVEKLAQWLPHLDWTPAAVPDPLAAAAATATADATSAPAPIAAPAAAPFEQAMLDEFSGGDQAKARWFLQQYCQAAADDLRALDEARQGRNGAVAEVAHRMKGAALMIGAHEVASIAATMEQHARAAPGQDFSAATDALRQAVARVQQVGAAAAGTH